MSKKHYMRPLCEPFAVSGQQPLLQASKLRYGTNVSGFVEDPLLNYGTSVIGFQDDPTAGGSIKSSVAGFEDDNGSGGGFSIGVGW